MQKLTTILCLLIGVYSLLYPTTPDIPQYSCIPEHPYLFLEPDTKNNIDSLVYYNKDIAFVHNHIINYSNWVLSQEVLQRKLTGIRLLNISREAFKRIFYLSYSFYLTKDEKYATRTIKEILALCDYEDWNPSHFLDVAEITLAIAIGYDWLYDFISPSDKDKIIKSINKKAFIPSFDRKYSRFKDLSNNWNSVCNAALLAAAIVFRKDLPYITDRIIEECITTNFKALEKYSPDGGYPEGYCYWEYGTTFQVLLIDILIKNFGYDFGLFDVKGFKDTGRFIQFMSAPSGKCFNFSDSPEELTMSIPLWWFAEKNKDVSLLYLEQNLLETNQSTILKSRLLPLLPIFASRCKKIDKVKPKDTVWVNGGSTPIFIYRSDWDKATDSYLGIKGGSPSTPHGHMDAGSFIYEYNGKRWSVDLGMPDYNSIEEKGINLWDKTQNGDRWKVMNMQNDFHSTLTIDSLHHKVNSKAEFIDIFRSSAHKGVIIDLTSTLGKVKLAHREISLDRNNYLTIKDKIETNDTPIALTWIMLTPAEAEIYSDSLIILKQQSQSMNLLIDSPIKINPHIWSNNPIDDKNSNENLRVGFSMELPANIQTTIKVTLEPRE